ncbi:MAG: hypothetical protein ACI8P0_000674 [Planctomycetaceae bacterium]|jgi:hypothetical protein
MQPTAAGVTRGVTESSGQDGWLVDERSEPPVICRWGARKLDRQPPVHLQGSQHRCLGFRNETR